MPNGKPALVNPINSGIDEQEQSVLNRSNKKDIILAFIP